MEPWIVITGGGSGIGRGLVHHFAGRYNVLTCGRRGAALLETQKLASRPEAVTFVACDIGVAEGRAALVAALPQGAPVRLLVQNAAIGDPAPLDALDIDHFEETLRVNVVAPLALVKGLLPALKAGSGRILHIGTSVAFNPQVGTATYGVSKIAFHRLYQQLKQEDLGGVAVGSLSPGMVDTEGVRDHVAKARALNLPHVRFFDDAFAKGWTTEMSALAQFVEELLHADSERFSAQEWRFSDWRKGLVDLKAASTSTPLADYRLPAIGAYTTSVAWAVCAAAFIGGAMWLSRGVRPRL